jgi:hypothetical protein
MAQCVTCGSELHPDRAVKYDYCMAPACQEKNLKGLTMVAVGVNKAADQYLILDDQTRDDLAGGKFRDQRRGSFGTSVPSASVPSATVPSATVPSATVPSATVPSATVPSATVPSATVPSATVPSVTSVDPATPRTDGAQRGRRQSQRRSVSPQPTRRAWSKSQEKLALLYNEQGLRPEEIAQKLRLTPYTVSQIILASRNLGKL